MITVSRRDVVLVDYPYTDRAGSKVRPCIVVQNDHDNQRMDDTIVVLMTSKTRFTAGSKTELLIAADSPSGKQAGLIFDSAVQGQNLLTVDRSFIRRKIGIIPAETMSETAHASREGWDSSAEFSPRITPMTRIPSWSRQIPSCY
jgi:mRNA interferase MazF